MQQIFVELYNYGPAWGKCSENERTEFVKKVIEAVNGLKSAGVDVIAYGKNSHETDRRAPYDFFASIVCRALSSSANLNARSLHPVGTITSSR